MRAFMLTPVVFVVLFLLAFSISSHFFSIDKRTAEGIAKEALVKKKMADVEKNLTIASALAFQTIVNSQHVMDEATMKGYITTNLASTLFSVNDVTLSPTGRNTRIDFKLQLEQTPQFDYSTIIGHPYAVFSNLSAQYTLQRACSYVRGGGCKYEPKWDSKSMKTITKCVGCYYTYFASPELESDLNYLKQQGFNVTSIGNGYSTHNPADTGSCTKNVILTIKVTDPLNSLIAYYPLIVSELGPC